MQAVDFPTYLRKAMTAVRLGQADLARASGIGEAQISRWLRGQNQPDLPNLRRLSKPLARPLLELLVASGHLKPREAAMKDLPAPPSAPVVSSVPDAITADQDLEEEGKRALKQHYAGLVLFARQQRELDVRSRHPEFSEEEASKIVRRNLAAQQGGRQVQGAQQPESGRPGSIGETG